MAKDHVENSFGIQLQDQSLNHNSIQEKFGQNWPEDDQIQGGVRERHPNRHTGKSKSTRAAKQ